jgi:hypothetical protein
LKIARYAEKAAGDHSRTLETQDVMRQTMKSLLIHRAEVIAMLVEVMI